MPTAPDARVQQITRGLELAALAGALVLLATQAGAPGWGRAPELAGAAHRMAPGVSPGSPGAGVLGKLATLVPVGDLGFRVSALSIVAVLAALAGVIALARALVPDERVAGTVAAAVAATTPVVVVAGTSAGADALGAALVVWATTLAVRARRGGTGAVAAMALAIATLAVQPAVGAAVVAVIAAAVIRRRAHAVAAATLLVAALPLWSLVIGRGAAGGGPADLAELPTWMAVGVSLHGAGERAADLLTALGHGSGGPLLLAGVIGLGFAAVTGLRGAALPLAVAAATLLAAATVGGGPGRAAPTLLLLAAGVAPLAGAIARGLAREPTARGRLAIGGAAAAPVALLALLAPADDLVDPGGDLPGTAARAVIGELPAGPGVVVLTSVELWSAARLEQAIGGERPDLALVPRGGGAERVAVVALRAGRPVGSDVAAFDRLDPRLAAPRGRGFQLLLEAPPIAYQPLAPARWAGPTGAALAEELALARASYEAVRGRLDAAARAAGLDGGRFHAADVALLAAAVPGRARPALYGYVPRLGPAGRLGLGRELFGDDLAWVAGLDPQPLGDDAAPERQLHALWREILAGARVPDDPAVAALGRAAEIATAEALYAVGRPELARVAVTAGLAHGPDTTLSEVLRALDDEDDAHRPGE